jgi:hypothetical protein
MFKKKLMLAAVSMSALALYATAASAQATVVYSSPAQARTYGETSSQAPSAARLDRVMRDRRGLEPFAAAPRGGGFNQPTVGHRHTDYISSY